MTQRLRSVFGHGVTVKILYHAWKPAFVDESRLLAMPIRRYQLIREVLLHVDGKPLVLARTVLPEATIRIARRNLSHLGTRPLGEVIFAYPDLERRRRDYCRVAPHDWLAPIRDEYPLVSPVWGRRTLYAIHAQPLLVSEFFLNGWIEKDDIPIAHQNSG